MRTEKDDAMDEFEEEFGSVLQTKQEDISENQKLELSTEEEDDSEEIELPDSLTETEKLALSKGWEPNKEKVEQLGKDYIPAEEFLRREPLFERINKLNKKLSSQEREFKQVIARMDELVDIQTQKNLEAEKMRLRELVNAHVDAGSMTASEAADAYAVELEKLTAKPAPKKSEQPEQQLDSEVEDFINRHAKILKDEDKPQTGYRANPMNVAVQHWCLAEYRKLSAEGHDVADIVESVEARMKNEFPQLFSERPKKVKQDSASEFSDSGVAPPRRVNTGSLKREERQALAVYKQWGMSNEEALKIIAKHRGAN